MSDIKHIPDTASPDLLSARADAWAGNAIAEELKRQAQKMIDDYNAAEQARRNGNGGKDETTQKGRP